MPRFFAIVLLCLSCHTARAAEPGADDLARVLRQLLLEHLPTPLVASENNWGEQKLVHVGWKLKAGKLDEQYQPRNHGTWRRMHVDVDRPETSLKLAVGNLVKHDASRTTFDLYVSFDANIFFEQQIWQNGHRFYSGSTRARCKVALGLNCESVTRVEKTSGLLPDAVIRLRVLKSYLNYSDVVVEHTAGVGGTAAKLLGETALAFVRQVKPSLERDLHERANAAIVKASDTKELRLSFSKLLSLPLIGK